MKYLCSSLFLACMLLPCTGFGQVKTGDRAPDFGQRDIFDEKTEYWVSDFVGPEATDRAAKALLLSFSASYCKPCWKELPDVLKLKGKYGSKGFEVWTVLVDQENEGREKGKKQLASAKGKIVCTRMAGRKMANDYLGTKHELPALFLIDKDGKVVDTLKGLDKGGLKQLERKLKKLVE